MTSALVVEAARRAAVESSLIGARVEAERAVRTQSELLGSMHFMQRITVAANQAVLVEEVTAVTLREICGVLGWLAGHAHLVDEDEPGVLASARRWHIEDDEATAASFRRASEELRFTAAEGPRTAGSVDGGSRR